MFFYYKSNDVIFVIINTITLFLKINLLFKYAFATNILYLYIGYILIYYLQY